MIFAKPNPDRLIEGVPLMVRDIDTRLFIPQEGQYVDPVDLYWARRLSDGDLVPAEPPAE